MTARRNDPDYAEWLMSQPESGRWTPPAHEWDLSRELQAAVLDRLGDLITLMANLNRQKGKPAQKPPERFPRPVTAIERARAHAERRIEAELDALIDAAHATYAAEHANDGG